MTDRELTTIAFCWRIERRDGLALGFTSHDRDFEVAGLRYRSAPGILPSAITLSAGFASETLDVAGALTSGAIAADDLAAGRWDGAGVSIFAVDRDDPDGGRIALAAGELGDVAMRGQAFEAELRGAAARLDRPVVAQTSPHCRAQLGDKRCRVDMAGRVRTTTIVAVAGECAIEVASAPPGTGSAFGRLRWMSGRNAGLHVGVAASDGALLTLRDPPHFPAAAGDRVELSEGCDKRLETCSGRFANAVNFRGEPHLPGGDLLTRYGSF